MKMKKNKGLLVVVLLLLFLCTACGNTTSDDKSNSGVKTNEKENKEKEVKKLSFTCENNYVKIETPDTWAQYPGKDKLNKDSCLELVGLNNKEDKYLLIISEDKNQFKSYNAWFDIVYGTAKNSYELDDSQLRRSDENGLNTRFIEKDLEIQGEKVYLQLYFLETNKYYTQVLMWTDNSNKATLSTEFRDIAYSLKEVE